ncbi:hypothetical protein SVTN_10795 [Streptomyces vietnamensis]|uniref:Uncharacterized protein n=1 Tax=Streptomyces vietnamensis TaxID=362257 RepID=A0A0B5HWN2_9ACTN|nr:hypothetical protein SVTN_10795 [Streptomyces vietnamensis]
MVVVAASAEIHTGEYARPTTGIGQVRAMSLLVPLLVRAYRGIDLEQVLLSSRTPGRDLEADMLTLGGPKNNEVTSMLLKAVPQLPFTVDGSSIRWQGTTYEGRAVGEQVVHDYGYIVRAPNPFAQDKRIVVVGGSHTFGTVAAARWLAENGDARNLPADVAVLVEAEVLQDGHVVRPRMLHTAEI